MFNMFHVMFGTNQVLQAKIVGFSTEIEVSEAQKLWHAVAI